MSRPVSGRGADVGAGAGRRKRRRDWPLSMVPLTPDRRRPSLHLDPRRFSESLRQMTLERLNYDARSRELVKKGLLRSELDLLFAKQTETTHAVLEELNLLQTATQALGGGEDRDRQRRTDGREGGATAPSSSPTPRGGPEPRTAAPRSSQNYPRDDDAEAAAVAYAVTIFPGDPSFAVLRDLRHEFLEKIYSRSSQWLPNFGRWYGALTTAAVQRRVFPRELRGSENFQNSTSLKLMKAISDVTTNITRDFYIDPRNLTDTQAALSLLNAYYINRQGAPVPNSVEELAENLAPKLATLLVDLKKLYGEGLGRSFTFALNNPQQAETLAPVNKNSKYNSQFFSSHTLYNLLASVGLFPSSRDLDVAVADDAFETGDGDEARPTRGRKMTGDLTYLVTSTVFGDAIPPFLNYQWNLRAGLASLEILLLAFILLENVRVTRGGDSTGQSRFQLAALLGDDYLPPQRGRGGGGQGGDGGAVAGGIQFHKKGSIFEFLNQHYLLPIIRSDPQVPMTKLFPGVALVALETNQYGSRASASGQLIQLTTKKFNDFFEIINQRFTFRDASHLLQAQTSLRFQLESGLSRLLESVSTLGFVREIIKKDYGARDDYDLVYFLVLGFLPAPVAVV